MPKKITPLLEVEKSEDEISSNGTTIVQLITEKPSFINLIKFTAKEASITTIKEKRAEYDLVVIDGVDDTANYKTVVANMGQMRDDRRLFENAAYENAIDPLKKALKEYADDIEAVVLEFKAGEQSEREKKDFIDNEKKRIKKEKEEAKVKAALARATTLFTLGAKFDGQVYSFEYDAGLLINTMQLTDFGDDEFGEFAEDVKIAFDAEEKRKADKIIEEEAEAEKQRLITEANEATNKVLAEKQKNLRLKELKLLGGVQDDEYFTVKGSVIPLSAVLEFSDEDWDELISTIEQADELPADVETEIDLVEQLESAGFVGSSGEVYEPFFADGEIASGNPVSEPEQSFVDNEANIVEVEETLLFTSEAPYITIPLPGGFEVRLFSEHMKVTMSGPVKQTGDIQGNVRYAVVQVV